MGKKKDEGSFEEITHNSW